MMKTLTSIVLTFLFLFPFVSAMTLDLHSPLEKTYGNNYVLFNLSSTEKGDFYYSILDKPYSSGSWIKLCTNVKSCVKKKLVSEGDNRYEFKVINRSQNSDDIEVLFKVDSKKPRISKISPRTGSIVGQNRFTINYSEENLKEITLYYQTSSGINSTTKVALTNDEILLFSENFGDEGCSSENSWCEGMDFNQDRFVDSEDLLTLIDKYSGQCIAGLNMGCEFSIPDLSQYNGQFLEFWFVARDEFNSAQSHKSRIKIDTSEPNMDVKGPIAQEDQNGKTRMKFIFDLQEPNFKEISYTTINDCDEGFSSAGIFCRSLNAGRCSAVREFCKGAHNLSINAIDKAGNVKTIYKNFTVQ